MYLRLTLTLFDYSVCSIQGGSNMTGTNCDLFTHNQSRSYLNHLVGYSAFSFPEYIFLQFEYVCQYSKFITILYFWILELFPVFHIWFSNLNLFYVIFTFTLILAIYLYLPLRAIHSFCLRSNMCVCVWLLLFCCCECNKTVKKHNNVNHSGYNT
jgi:hypothetical protein